MHRLLSKAGKSGSERAFALLLVILILAGLMIIGVPFAVSMRLSSRRSQTALANAHARFAAEGAYNHAIACLMRTQEQHDLWPVVRFRPTDSTLFESHTLDIPAELAVSFDGEVDPDLDLTGELETRNPRGAIWSVEVEDEQGKINLNSASEHLIENLLYLLGPDIDADPQDEEDAIKEKRVSAAESATLKLLNYRRKNAGFHTVSEAESVLSNTELFNSGQLAGLSRFTTVSSQRPNRDAPHPINVNSAPELVLVANMMNLRLRHVPAEPDADNKGNGSVSPVRLTEDAREGDWRIEFGDSEVSLYFRDVEDEASWTLQQADIPVDQPVTIGNGITFTIYSGTIPFSADDAFYFSTRRISEEIARDLARAMQADVKVTAGQVIDDGIQSFTVAASDAIAAHDS